MTSGYPCPECGEHVRPFEGCLCPLPGERCPDCGGYVDGGKPGCGCEDDEEADK